MSSTRKNLENKTRQSVDEIAKVVIRFNLESARQNKWNRSGLNVIKSELGDKFEIVPEERRLTLSLLNSLEVSTTDHETLSSSQMRNRLPEVNERDSKSTSNKILRIIRDRIVGHGISGNIQAKENTASSEESVSQSTLTEEENRYARGKDIDFAKNTSQSTSSSVQGKPDDQILASNSPWKRKHEAQFSRRVSASGAAIAVAMIVIGTIMLLLTPAVVVLRLLDKRRRARKSQNELPDDATWQDLPPTYEQVVLMNEEAPRYSTLVLSNQVDDDVHLSPFPSTLSPSPSPSPSPSSSPLPLSISSLTFSPTYGSSLDLSTIKSYSHR